MSHGLSHGPSHGLDLYPLSIRRQFMTQPTGLTFESREALSAWLKEHHATATELWVRMYKKGTGTPSVNWEDCVIVALSWGWIDGQRRSGDETSFLQRLTPRRPKSGWSKKNCDHAEKLIAEGHMHPSGLQHVLAAKADGRWDSAYAGSSDMVLPEDFLQALSLNPAAEQFFATLKKNEHFAIYYRLSKVKGTETRARKIAAFVDGLAAGRLPTAKASSGKEA